MSINSEIADLEANLAAAKAVVARKGGTVGDTGLYGLAEEIASIPGGNILVTGVSITSPSSIYLGEDLILTADVIPADATNKAVSWTSSDTNAISVSQDSQTGDWIAHPVTAGGAVLTVTTADGGYTDSITMTVTESWGAISYYDFSQGWVEEMTTRCTINSVNTEKLQDYLDSVEHSEYEEVWFQYNKNDKVWRDRNVSPTVDIQPENLETTTGINVTISDPDLSANFRLRKEYIVDTTSQPTRKSITQSEYESLNTDIYNIGGLDIPCSAVYSFAFASAPTTTPTSFLSGCSNLEVLDTSGATGLTSIQNNFLTGCSLFNQEFIIPANVTTIGDYFLGGCSAFDQPLTIPNNVTSIGAYFLCNCSSFNHALTLPSNLTIINSQFLWGCSSFNQTFVFPETVNEIGQGFLNNCTSFNQPLTLPATIRYIENSFMSYCTSFNQPLVIPDSVVRINDYFMSHCTSFNQTLTLPSINSYGIGMEFLSYCSSFNQPLTIAHNGVLGVSFMRDCTAFNSPLTFSNYLEAPNLFLYNCSSFNQSLDVKFTGCGSNFLEGCSAFNQPLQFASMTSRPGDYFMRNCSSFNQDIEFSSFVNGFGRHFFVGCDSMTSTLKFSYTGSGLIMPNNDDSFTTTDNLAPCYTQGIKIQSDPYTMASIVYSRFPASDASPYRKLVNTTNV